MEIQCDWLCLCMLGYYEREIARLKVRSLCFAGGYGDNGDNGCRRYDIARGEGLGCDM